MRYWAGMDSSRILPQNRQPIREGGAYVLCWLISSRRAASNFCLERAVEMAIQLQKPLVILEDLRLEHRWASPRFHQFVLQGMADTSEAMAKHPVVYHPYVEQQPGEGRALLSALCADASMVVTDYYPCFFLPQMVQRLGERLPIRVEAVDGNGLLPLATSPQAFPTAYLFRRFLQKNLAPHLGKLPKKDPLAGVSLPRYTLPPSLLSRWPSALVSPPNLSALSLDHAVSPVSLRGGSSAALLCLHRFLFRLEKYGEHRNDPDIEAASGLSPYLHFGHISTHQVFAEVMGHEEWDVTRLGAIRDGSREGWWGTSAAAESFLDELVTWRELGFVFQHHRPDYDRYDSLPDWAKQTLEKHRSDTRPVVYSREQLEGARTHDPIWNAAQRQLRQEGRIHNYLRMLWGKKILEWSESPQVALEHLIELNNRWALDGRDPNSYSGIFWTLGRFDRAWGPEREIYGTVRYMSSDNTARKVALKDYLRRFGRD